MNSNTDLPLVSIIAICYNQAKYLVETLDSIKRQTYPNIQLIIVDDCSKDGSVKLIEQWINENIFTCEFIRHSKNMGVSRTCNDGLKRVEGQYYQILACDDVLYPGKIEHQVKLLHSSEDDIAVLYSDVEVIDENSQATAKSFYRTVNWSLGNGHYEGTILKELLVKAFIPNPGTLIKTSIAKKTGGYNERLFFEDYGFWLQVAAGYKFKFDPQILSKYRIHQKSLSNIEKRDTRYYETIIRLWGKYLGFSSEIDLVIRNNFIHRFNEYVAKVDFKSGVRLHLFRTKKLKNNYALYKLFEYIVESVKNSYHHRRKYQKIKRNNKIEEQRKERYKIAIQKITHKQPFSIISSNCWAGAVYEDLHRQYLTPTVGLYFFAPDFISFIKNLKENIDAELRFIKKSRYEEANNFISKHHDYPIGLLDERIEIHFLHYRSEEEALEKWNRRKKRIIWDNLYIACTDRDRMTEEIMQQFDQLPYQKKIIFTAKKYKGVKSSIYLSGYKGRQETGDIYNERHIVTKDFKLDKWIK